jgi:hypothetical protein
MRSPTRKRACTPYNAPLLPRSPPPLSPKIQRLVTPICLQRRRHLNALKRRKLEHQKEHTDTPLPQPPALEMRRRKKGKDRGDQGLSPQVRIPVSFLVCWDS